MKSRIAGHDRTARRLSRHGVDGVPLVCREKRIMSKSVLHEVPPAQITEEIRRFCEEVAPGQTPVYVPVLPRAGAVASRCHINVEQCVKASGGSLVSGWIIWQSPALLHAEFHSNWQSPSGELTDITPKVDGEKNILFLPDPNTRWQGRLVPSHRKVRRDDPLLSLFVEALEKRNTIWAKYPPGQAVSDFDVFRIAVLSAECQRLERSINRGWTASPAQQGASQAERRAEKKKERKRKRDERRRRK